MRATASKPLKAPPRRKAAPAALRCSHCGDALTREELAHCDDCLFVYCRKHHGATLHLCAVICAECPAEE